MCLAPTARHSPQSLGQRPRLRETKKNPTSAGSAIHFRHQFDPLGSLRRAFSACCWSNQIPGARTQAGADKAPSALNKYSGRAFGVSTSVPAAVQASARRFFQLPTQSDTRTHRSSKAPRAKRSAIASTNIRSSPSRYLNTFECLFGKLYT